MTDRGDAPAKNMAKKRPHAASVWQGVRLLRAFGGASAEKLQRSKRVYMVALEANGTVSVRSGSSALAIAARDVGAPSGLP